MTCCALLPPITQWRLRGNRWCNLTCDVFDSILNTRSHPTFSIYRMWWVIQQPVLGEPWRVLSFCHLHDKLPRQWTWRAGALIQFQLLTLGIRRQTFASLEKAESPPQKKEREEKREKMTIIWTQSNEMKANILYLSEGSGRWTALIWAQTQFRDPMLQTARYSKWFGSIVFARNSRNKERESEQGGGGQRKERKSGVTVGEQESTAPEM